VAHHRRLLHSHSFIARLGNRPKGDPSCLRARLQPCQKAGREAAFRSAEGRSKARRAQRLINCFCRCSRLQPRIRFFVSTNKQLIKITPKDPAKSHVKLSKSTAEQITKAK
jgi:hypothetical protein